MRARILAGSGGQGYIIPFANYNFTWDDCGNDCNPDVCGAGQQFGFSNTELCLTYQAIDGLLQYDSSGNVIVLGPSPGPDLSVTGDIDSSWDPTLLNATPYSIAAELASADWIWLQQADALFITPAYIRLQQIYLETGLAAIDGFLSFLYAFVAAFLTCFVAVMVLVFMPQVKVTNDDIQKKRGMLLFLPPQVVRNVPSIRSLINEILSEDPSGLASSLTGPAGRGTEDESGGPAGGPGQGAAAAEDDANAHLQ